MRLNLRLLGTEVVALEVTRTPDPLYARAGGEFEILADGEREFDEGDEELRFGFAR